LLIVGGTLNASLVHPREVFEPAARHFVAQIILAHNHPSGDPKPSKEDIEVTEKLIESGNLLGITDDDYLAYLGLFLAEGCTCSLVRKSNYRVIVTQCNSEKMAIIRLKSSIFLKSG